MRKNQWFKWFIIEIDKTIQQAADGRVCLRKKLTKNGLLLLDKTRLPTHNSNLDHRSTLGPLQVHFMRGSFKNSTGQSVSLN